MPNPRPDSTSRAADGLHSNVPAGAALILVVQGLIRGLRRFQPKTVENCLFSQLDWSLGRESVLPGVTIGNTC